MLLLLLYSKDDPVFQYSEDNAYCHTVLFVVLYSAIDCIPIS